MARQQLGLLLLCLWAVPAHGQTPYEAVGSRALGMAGAFVAVADDPTAVYWNPAGLATAGPVGATVEWYRFQNGNREGPPLAGPGLDDSRFGTLGSWPLGVSYGRLSSRYLVEGPGGQTLSRRLSTSQFGVTVLQTLVEGLVIGSTLKYVRGTVASAPAAGQTAEEALDAIAELDGRTSGTFDLDVGLMADLQRLRIGLVWKNLRTPEFDDGAGTAIEVPRQTRLGIAVLPTTGLTLAMDVDLDTVDLRDGLRRMIAFGGEGHLGARIAVRTGVRWNLEGERRPVTAVGASIALQPRLWIDGHYSRGQSAQDRGFGVAMRAVY